MRVRREERRRARREALPRQRGGLAAAALAPDRLELRPGRVARGQLPARARQHPPPPGAEMPRKARARLRRVDVEGSLLRGRPVAVPEPREVGAEVARLPDPLRLQERLGERPVPQGGGREGAGPARHAMRVVQGAAQDEPRDGVDVRRGGLAPEPHGFEGDGPAPREGVEDPGRPPAERRADLLPEPRQLGGGLAPPMEDPAGRLLLLPPPGRLPRDVPPDPMQQRPAAVASGVVEQGRQQHRPARGQGPPRRPDMQGGDVPVAHVLLVHGVDGRLLERKPRLDQAAVVTAVTHRPCSRGESCALFASF